MAPLQSCRKMSTSMTSKETFIIKTYDSSNDNHIEDLRAIDAYLHDCDLLWSYSDEQYRKH